MKNFAIAFAVFTTIEILWAFLHWLGGYNFDHRGPDVVAAVMFGLIIGGGASILTYVTLEA